MRYLRILFSTVLFLLLNLTLFGALRCALPARWQFVPALLSGGGIILLTLLIGTALLGRVYCSVFCPLGYLMDIVRRLARCCGLKPKGYRRAPRWISYLMLVLTALSAWPLHAMWLRYIDPYSAYVRLSSQLFRPLWLCGHNLLTRLNDTTGWHLTLMESPDGNLPLLGVAIATLVLVLLMTVLGGRLYCNTLCPVGALLGLLSRYSVLSIRTDATRCNGCGRCAKRCKAACIDLSQGVAQVDTSRCVSCYDCLDDCPRHALKYTLRRHSTAETAPDNGRRQFLSTVTALAAAAPLAKAQRVLYETTTGERWEKKIHTTMPDGSPAASRFWPIMPPCTVSRERFEQRCTACQLCISRCPQHILKPALREYGVEGLMLPTVSYERGWCRPDCNLCSTLCPTEAIRPLPIAQKRKDKMGWANFNSRHCVTQTDDVECGLCARRCPEHAITLVEKNGHKVPRVQVSLCTGCGACEYYCPARPKAIYVEGLMF